MCTITWKTTKSRDLRNVPQARPRLIPQYGYQIRTPRLAFQYDFRLLPEVCSDPDLLFYSYTKGQLALREDPLWLGPACTAR